MSRPAFLAAAGYAKYLLEAGVPIGQQAQKT
jgi:hypothetical protein